MARYEDSGENKEIDEKDDDDQKKRNTWRRQWRNNLTVTQGGFHQFVLKETNIEIIVQIIIEIIIEITIEIIMKINVEIIIEIIWGWPGGFHQLVLIEKI